LRVSLARVASVLSLLALVGCGSHSREARKPDVRKPDTTRRPLRSASPSVVAIPGGAGHLTAMAPPSNSDLRALMKVVPIGTPVVISA
jgi:hypothetical protein